MEVIINKINENIYIPNAINYKISGEKICFFDIETTGFNGKKDKIILIGLLYIEKNSIVIKQFFAENIDEEKELLLNFKNDISKFDAFITYNGDSFDIPFLNEKYKSYNVDFSLNKLRGIDLIKVIRKNKKILELDNCSLKTVEEKLGLRRDDKITGKDSAKMYKSYIKNKSLVLKNTIIKHNYDDIFYLPKILRVYDLVENLKKISFNVNMDDKKIEVTFNIDFLTLDKDTLSIVGTTSALNLCDQIYYNENYTFNWNPIEGSIQYSFQIHDGLFSDGKKCVYIDKNDFPLVLSSLDITNYNVPSNIIILKINNDYITNNLRNILEDMLLEIFRKVF